jgi:hypothetical protein
MLGHADDLCLQCRKCYMWGHTSSFCAYWTEWDDDSSNRTIEGDETQLRQEMDRAHKDFRSDLYDFYSEKHTAALRECREKRGQNYAGAATFQDRRTAWAQSSPKESYAQSVKRGPETGRGPTTSTYAYRESDRGWKSSNQSWEQGDWSRYTPGSGGGSSSGYR